MPNVMAALPNTGGTMAPPVQRRKIWLTPTTKMSCSNAAKTRNPFKLAGVPKLPDRSQTWAEVHYVVGTCGGDIDA